MIHDQISQMQQQLIGGNVPGQKVKISPYETARSSDATVAQARVGFSHDRPDVALEILHKERSIPPVKLNTITFLRPVHSQRVSMVEKYVTSVLTQAINKKNGKGEKVKGGSKPSYKDWVYLDGKNVPWQQQTYAQPQLGKQKIGVGQLSLDGARSYQLKWVARGRDHQAAQNSHECGGSDQTSTETCADAKLLEQGKRALMDDYVFFGLLHRFEESVCLLHYHSRMPFPTSDSANCAANFRSNCLRVNSCSPNLVCPPDASDENINDYHKADYKEVEALIQEIEKPELALLEWAETEFNNRFAQAKADITCQIEAGVLTGKESWMGDNCWTKKFTHNKF